MSVYNILLFILQYYITSRILSMHLMQHAGVVFLILYILQYFLQLYRNILYILHQYKVYNTGNFITHRNNMIYIYMTHTSCIFIPSDTYSIYMVQYTVSI